MKKALRVLFGGTLLLAMLMFMTAEKVSYVWTVRAAGGPHVTLSSGSSVVLLLVLVPYSLALLQGVWNVSFLTKCHDRRLPPLHNIVLGVLSCVLEAACVVWFQLLVAPYVPVYILLPAMSIVLSVGAWSACFALPHVADFPGDELSLSKDQGASTGRQCLSFLPPLGCCAVAVVLYLWGSLHWLSCVAMVVSLVLLAVIWSPGIQYRTISIDGRITHNCKRLKVVYTFLKVVCIIFFVLVDVVAFSPPTQPLGHVIWNFCSHIAHLKDLDLVVPLLINILSGLVMHAMVYLGVAFCLPALALVMTSVLSTIISIGLCVGIVGPSIYRVDELEGFGAVQPLLVSGGVLAFVWVLAYGLVARHALHGPGYLFIQSDHLLLDYGWCPGFSDLRRLLSYHPQCVCRDSLAGQPKRKTKNRVYICTTMYREADYEMQRLLLSLQRLSQSDSLLDVYLEAHIFMDNGIKDTQLGDFALQLVGLLINHMGINPNKARCRLTPYGMQIMSYLAGGMPLFVHLKDPAKVKPKKRWSQCMYINYVMNFRKALWKQDESFTSLSDLKHTPEGDIFFVGSECSSGKAGGNGLESDKPILTSSKRNNEFRDSEIEKPSEIFYTSVHGIESASTAVPADPNHMNYCFHAITSPVFSGTKRYGNITSHTENGVHARTTPAQDDDLTFTSRCDADLEVDDDHTYILATDADMDFQPEAVAELLQMCSTDRGLGAACGRTHPIGHNCSSIVWHQIFEYAKDFWMIKSAQNVIGSVMCCPGCFSLYRASAIRQVMDTYATPTKTSFTVYVKDTGEDRWMATLMMIQGWRLGYSAFANNTTYCPDTFDEFFKQRRRWILSDIANLILVVQNFPRLLRHNQSFSLIYVLYLLNMFLNNIITPGTAIVMITAGMDLVFDVPYTYTTPPLALVVFIYALFCTRCSTRAQTVFTSLLTFVLGTMFTALAVWGSFKIVSGMIIQINAGHFQFQQHYIILMLTASLLFAAVVHPREMYQITYGLAYLFIFPAMHLLLPIYSIANIIDQSWGTRESQTAKVPKLRCFPSLKKLLKRKKKKTTDGSQTKDTDVDIQQVITSVTRSAEDSTTEEQGEDAFWINLRHTLLGNDVNLGLERAQLSDSLERLRNYSLLSLLFINALWLAILSYFYVGIDSRLSRLNLYGLISGALYGFTLVIQVVGMTVCRVHHGLVKLARYLYGDNTPMWVYVPRDKENSVVWE